MTHGRILYMGYKCQIPLVKTLLTSTHHQRQETGERLEWLFLSVPKSYFLTRASFASRLATKVTESGGRPERCKIENVWSLELSFSPSVMIWGYMLPAGVSHLCNIKSSINTNVYQDILENFMLATADQLYRDADFIFQQDFAPIYIAKGTNSWCLIGQETHLTSSL